MTRFAMIILLVCLAGAGVAFAAEETVTEIIPATQAITTPDGTVVQPPPMVRTTTTEDPWGVVKIIVGIVAIIAAIRVLGVPALRGLLKDAMDVKGDISKLTARTDEQDKRFDRNEQKIEKLTGTGNGGLPPGN